LDSVNVGIIGIGGSGGWGHFPGYIVIPDKARVAAICDVNVALAQEKARIVGAKAYADYHDLLIDPKVDAVDICLPHFLHGQVAKEALSARKHVLVEKPFTTTLEEADRVIAATRDSSRKLMIAENTRFVNAYQVAKNFVDDGILGDILFART